MNKKAIILSLAFFVLSFFFFFSFASAGTPQPVTKWACSNPQGQFSSEAECENGCTVKCTPFNSFTPLVQLPGLGDQPGESLLVTYLSWLFRFALAAAAFLAVLQITIGGIQIIFGGASETARTNAKARISDAIWGLLLALGSFLILSTISPQFTDMKLTIPEIKMTVAKPAKPTTATTYECSSNSISTITGKRYVKATYKSLEECEAGCTEKSVGSFYPPGQGPSGGYSCRQTEPAAGADSSTKGLLNNSKITVQGPETAGCGRESGSDPQSVLRSAEKDDKCTVVCSPTCACSCRYDVQIDKNMLDATKSIGDKYPLTITSITGGKHAENSDHYKGKALDVVPASSDPAIWEAVVAEYKSRGAKGSQTSCDLHGNLMSCDEMFKKSGNNCGSGSGCHIHVSYNI